MTIPQFLDLVERMRAVQKEYFKTRDKNVLQESKRLEKEVDEALEKMGNAKEHYQYLLSF